MRERIIIVFIALAIGLLVTTLIFFLYQQTKSIPQTPEKTTQNTKTPAPTTQNRVMLSVDSPADQALVDRRSIQIKGKTDPENTIIVSTNQEDQIAKPTADGAFSVTVTIDAGSNRIVTRAITPEGEKAEDERIVTFSTEEF